VAPTPLLGREGELAQIERLLGDSGPRLLTLVGPGGVGKTRLALQAASALLDDFEEGVHFVPLAPVTDPDLVAISVASALGVRETPDQSALDRLKVRLRSGRQLLLLDNFEHVSRAAPLVAELLASCAELKALVTSRSVLRLRGEREYRVPPLALPASGRGAPQPDVLARSAAVQLFVERAQAVRPGFALTGDNARDIAEICRRLDGLPLAIELAAAWSKLMSPRSLLARLESRLAMLVDGAHDLPERQQTLRGAIGWSYDLLEPGGRALFAWLAVFAGGWELETAEAVCETLPGAARTPSVLDGLASLTDKSLVQQVERAGGETRFSMLETIREYATERLEASGEAETLRLRHAEHYLALAETADLDLCGPQQAEWLQRLDDEADNLRAALRWARESGRTELGLRMAGALEGYWRLRGYLSEGRTWLEELLATRAASTGAPVGACVQARALNAAATLAWMQGDLRSAEELAAESLTLFRPAGDTPGVARALATLGKAAHAHGDYKRAQALYEESLALHRGLGEKAGVSGLLGDLGTLARDQGDWERARRQHEESLALRQALRDSSGIAHSLRNLGLVAHLQGRYDLGEARLSEALALFREQGDAQGTAGSLNDLGLLPPVRAENARAEAIFEEALGLYHDLGDEMGVSWSLNNLGILAYDHGDYDRAVSLHEESLALRRALGAEPGTAVSLIDLGNAVHARGESARAAQAYRESLLLLHEVVGDKALMAFCIEGLARVALSEGRPERAVGLYGAADALREAISAPLPPPDRPSQTRTLARAREALTAAEYAAAWEAGRAMTMEHAIAEALAPEE
jgi:predicted ATPase